MTNKPPARRVPVGISQCLLGEPVRYNGGHKLSRVCTQLLGERFEYLPFCPEVAIGLGVPRPPIQLVASERGARALGVEDPGMDVTEALRDYAGRVAAQVAHLRGFIFMQKSPSCGLGSTPIHRPGEPRPVAVGSGLFAARLCAAFPGLPVVEAAALEDPELRRQFVERVLAYDAESSIRRRDRYSARADYTGHTP